MRVSPVELEQTQAAFEGEERATPVCFGGLAGMYHAAQGDTAVLLISPWGFEELCSRMTYRLLAERLAALGYPCLRFDLPGTGHSAFASAEIVEEDAWRRALVAAYDHLRCLSHLRKIIVLGQGLGGLLAAHLAQVRPVEGLVLLAPASQGRGHLREVAAWTAMTKAEFKVSSTDGPAGGLMSAGFVLSAATANEIRQLKPLGSLPVVVQRVLLAKRPENAGDIRLLEELSANGLSVDGIEFSDHADYVSSPIFGSVPEATLDSVLRWLREYFPVGTGVPMSDFAHPEAARLEGDGYAEEFARFGPSDMFFGAYTTPIQGAASKTAVLILNAGADHSVGWGRYSVDLARALGRQGVPTLRIEQAGIGETPLWPGQEQPVMYSLQANDDVACAIEWLAEKRGIERVVLVGRCSGAYPAFLCAVSDHRVAACVLINVRKLHWEPDEDILKAIREPVEPIDTYRQNLRSTRQFKRILSGELSVSTVVRKLSKTLVAVAARKVSPLLGNHSRHVRIIRIVQARLQALTAREVPVALIYSQGDPGLHDLCEWAGTGFAKLAAHPNVEVHVIEGADHNLSPMPVRAEVTERISQFLKSRVIRVGSQR